jgi:GNAT superfamily N-acetyltransferase
MIMFFLRSWMKKCPSASRVPPDFHPHPKIQKLLENVNDPKLHELFKLPNNPQPPFDILFEFPGFGAHFQALIRSRTKLAEIGRVAVDPDYRGKGLSEALVDTAASFAKARQVSCIFLACQERLGPLYAKCGFVAPQGLRSEQFFNIKLPSIVMERRL